MIALLEEGGTKAAPSNAPHFAQECQSGGYSGLAVTGGLPVSANYLKVSSEDTMDKGLFARKGQPVSARNTIASAHLLQVVIQLFGNTHGVGGVYVGSAG